MASEEIKPKTRKPPRAPAPDTPVINGRLPDGRFVPSPTVIDQGKKPQSLAEYMADKGRAMREHVGLPPMPQLKPCNAPSDDDICALAMCYCTAKEIKDIGSDDWIVSSRAISKALLKRKMLERALSGDSQMMTWLSKQHLGYREPKQDEQQQTTINLVSSSMPTVLNDRVIEVNQ